MARELSSFTPGTLAPRGGYAGAAVSTSAASFVRGDAGWGDLPREAHAYDPRTGEMVDEGVEDFTSFAKKIDGVPHQMQVAWRAYTDRILTVRLVRVLVARADGALTPAGTPWRVLRADTYYAARAPRRTRGLVESPVAEVADQAPSGGHADVPADQRDAARVMRYLPPAVQATVAASVPSPDTWLGALIQAERAGVPEAHHLRMLRMGDGHAVVVRAERHRDRGASRDPKAAHAALSRTPWHVTQVTYELTRDMQVGSSTKAHEIEGGR